MIRSVDRQHARSKSSEKQQCRCEARSHLVFPLVLTPAGRSAADQWALGPRPTSNYWDSAGWLNLVAEQYIIWLQYIIFLSVTQQ